MPPAGRAGASCAGSACVSCAGSLAACAAASERSFRLRERAVCTAGSGPMTTAASVRSSWCANSASPSARPAAAAKGRECPHPAISRLRMEPHPLLQNRYERTAPSMRTHCCLSRQERQTGSSINLAPIRGAGKRRRDREGYPTSQHNCATLSFGCRAG